MPVARLGQNPPGHVVHIGGQVGVGFRYLPLIRPQAHGGAFLQRQSIERYVLRGKGGQPGNRVLPLVEALVGQAVHQVEVDVIEPGATGSLEGLDGPVRAVASAQQLQQSVVEALHTDTKAVYALPQQPPAGLGVQVAGVGLDGDLGVRSDDEGVVGSLQDGGYVAVGKIGRGASAEKYGAHLRMGQRPAPQPNLASHRLEVTPHLRLDALVGVEITVGALGLAKRHMDVQPHAGRGNCIVPGVWRAGVSRGRSRERRGECDRTTPGCRRGHPQATLVFGCG